jgi:hypothetical protein
MGRSFGSGAWIEARSDRSLCRGLWRYVLEEFVLDRRNWPQQVKGIVDRLPDAILAAQ